MIGLEFHAQLSTRTKLFCACESSFGDPPNTHVCPVCLGLPGSLPVLNGEALHMALVAAMALECHINPTSIFARKNYFYPDLPKGYQISQYERPLAEHGRLTVRAERASQVGDRIVGVRRIHMEEDAGKSVHGDDNSSRVDLNRAGTPLIEVVSEPDIRSAAEARETMKRLREVLMFVGVNDGNLEQGSLRCDANVSVRRLGDTTLGTRVEMKNINSFRFVEEALEIEIARQIRLYERGERFVQQTRGYNSDKRESYLLREKVGDEGYRYFPEPDLPPLRVDDAMLATIAARLPELPDAKRARLSFELGIGDYAAGVLTSHPRLAMYFEQAAMFAKDPVKLANFVQSEVMRDVVTQGLDAIFPVSARQVSALVNLIDEGAISGKQAKRVYAAMRNTDEEPARIVERLGMKVISDEGTLAEIAERIVHDHPAQAEQYNKGKTGVLGFFVGELMKATRGAADPKVASALLQAVLARRPR